MFTTLSERNSLHIIEKSLQFEYFSNHSIFQWNFKNCTEKIVQEIQIMINNDNNY